MSETIHYSITKEDRQVLESASVELSKKQSDQLARVQARINREITELLMYEKVKILLGYMRKAPFDTTDMETFLFQLQEVETAHDKDLYVLESGNGGVSYQVKLKEEVLYQDPDALVQFVNLWHQLGEWMMLHKSDGDRKVVKFSWGKAGEDLSAKKGTLAYFAERMNALKNVLNALEGFSLPDEDPFVHDPLELLGYKDRKELVNISMASLEDEMDVMNAVFSFLLKHPTYSAVLGIVLFVAVIVVISYPQQDNNPSSTVIRLEDGDKVSEADFQKNVFDVLQDQLKSLKSGFSVGGGDVMFSDFYRSYDDARKSGAVPALWKAGAGGEGEMQNILGMVSVQMDYVRKHWDAFSESGGKIKTDGGFTQDYYYKYIPESGVWGNAMSYGWINYHEFPSSSLHGKEIGLQYIFGELLDCTAFLTLPQGKVISFKVRPIPNKSTGGFEVSYEHFDGKTFHKGVEMISGAEVKKSMSKKYLAKPMLGHEAIAPMIDLFLKRRGDEIVRPWVTSVPDSFKKSLPGRNVQGFVKNNDKKTYALNSTIISENELDFPSFMIPELFHLNDIARQVAFQKRIQLVTTQKFPGVKMVYFIDTENNQAFVLIDHPKKGRFVVSPDKENGFGVGGVMLVYSKKKKMGERVLFKAYFEEKTINPDASEPEYRFSLSLLDGSKGRTTWCPRKAEENGEPSFPFAIEKITEFICGGMKF